MASQWAVIALLAKLGSARLVGQFSLGLAITAPVMLLANLQLRGVQASDAAGEYGFREYVAVRLVTTTVAYIVIAGLAFGLRLEPDTRWIVLAVGAAKAIESISDVVHGLLQRHERMDLVARALMVKGPLGLAAVAGTLAWTGDAILAISAVGVAWGVVLFAMDLRNAGRLLGYAPRTAFRIIRPKLDSVSHQRLWGLATKAAPMGLVMLLMSLNTNVPRYVVEWMLGTESLGIYVGIAYLIIAGNAVTNALGQSALPRLSQYYRDGAFRAFRRLTLKLMAIGLLLGGAGIAVAVIGGGRLLGALYSAEYADQGTLFVWIMIAATITYTGGFLGTAVTGMRKFSVQVPIHLMKIVVNTSLCLVLVPSVGLIGAAWALTASLAASMASYGVLVVRYTSGRVGEEIAA